MHTPVCFTAWDLFNLDMASLRTVSKSKVFHRRYLKLQLVVGLVMIGHSEQLEVWRHYPALEEGRG